MHKTNDPQLTTTTTKYKQLQSTQHTKLLPKTKTKTYKTKLKQNKQLQKTKQQHKQKTNKMPNTKLAKQSAQ